MSRRRVSALLDPEDEEGGLSYRMIPLAGKGAAVRQKILPRGTHSVAYQFLDNRIRAGCCWWGRTRGLGEQGFARCAEEFGRNSF